MLDNSHEAVCDNGNAYLYAYSILCCTPKPLYLEVLLKPFEEQFNEPSFLIKFSNILRRDVLGICQESKLSLIFFIPIPY